MHLVSKVFSFAFKVVRTNQKHENRFSYGRRDDGRRESAEETEEGCLEATGPALLVLALGCVTSPFAHVLRAHNSRMGYPGGLWS